ncbi:MAG: hypothetical protein HYX75_06995 [Acidobacteria bacterium]|nr:hypothetical protein [Acidobacteriota bacterium]
MKTQTMSLEQLRIAALDLLARELGPWGMVRFLQQYETGHGDYSIERHRWLDNTSVDELVATLRRLRKGKTRKRER